MKFRLIEQMWVGPAIGFIAGLWITEVILGGVFFALFGLFAQMGILVKSYGTKQDTRVDNDGNERTISFLGREEAYLQTIMSLAAIVIKADGVVSEKELQHLEKKLTRDFSGKFAQRQMEFLRLRLSQEYALTTQTTIVANEFSEASKIQLLHFLVGIATADGVLASAEYKCLQRIASKIELNLRTLDTILAMFRFRHEYDKQHERPEKKPTTQLLETAYQVLEISKSASDADVKKAYRRLAVVHHPDKVAHLGAEFQKTANDKFQVIVAAYELIQKSRGFV